MSERSSRRAELAGVDAFDFDALSLAELRRRQSSKWRDVPPDVLPAWVAELDVPLAPAVGAALRSAVALGDTGYVPEESMELAEAFADFAGRRFDWAVDPAHVCMVPDVTAGIDRMLRLVTRPGERVAMFVPAYPPFFETLEDGERDLVRLPLLDGEHGWHIDFDEVARTFADGVRAIILNNPHNPTGKVLTRAELERLLELACRHDVFVISDEIHAPLTLPGGTGGTHVPWLTLGPDAADRGVVITGATKAFNIAGLKCSVLVADGKARALVDRMPKEFKVMAGHLGAIASTAAFRHGDPWLDALLDHLTANRALLARRIAAMDPRVRWHPPQATYLAWLDLRDTGLGPDPARHILQRARLALSPGVDFDRTQGRGWARLNFGTTRHVLDDILSRLQAALTATT